MAYSIYSASTSPAFGATAANLSDSSNLTNGVCRSIYVGVTGNIKVTMANGDVIVFTNVPVGIFAVSVLRIWSTSTTASGLIALY